MDLDGNVYEDNEFEEEEEGPWFSMGTTKKEKMEARKPWGLSLIIKLVWRSIGYKFLLRPLQSMWRTQHIFTLIGLSNDFFIALFTNKKDYKVALLSGSWLIRDHYLHVQCWVPNFMPKATKIDSLVV